MATGLRLEIEPPTHGWATVRLTASGVELAFTASYTPRDSIGDLACAALGLIAGLPDQVVTWNTEPAEFDFRFVAVGGRMRLEVHEFPDSRRRWRRAEEPLAVIEEDATTVTRALWRGLRRLQGAVPTNVFAASWGHPFPVAVVERLSGQLRT